ncbi:MAG: aquaporin Z [Chlamydiales bacterium]
MVAFVAAAIYQCFTTDTFFPEVSEEISVWKAVFVEALFTFVLCSVVLAVATSDALKGNHIYGIAIGASFAAITFVGGPLSAGAFNPAVACGSILYDTLMGGSIFPFLGFI